MRAYNEELKNGVPHPDSIRNHLQRIINPDQFSTAPTLYKLINRFISGEIKHEGRNKSINTLKTYKTTLNHLLAFEKEKKYKLSFENMNLDFYNSFISYLISKDLNPNSIGKEIKNLKTFLSAANDFGYTTNIIHKHKKFKKPSKETDSIYITQSEIDALYRHDLSENKRLERVRDLFVFGCYVGLRFSDFSSLKPENIQIIDGEKFICKITKKTNEQVWIPCHPIILEIFEKYGNNTNNLPQAPSNQKFNDYIKEASKLTKLTEKGRLSKDPNKELWECISSHTARRSFATNYFLEGFSTLHLMKITGHRTETAFLKYIRTTKLDTAKRLNEHIKKNWTGKMLKVAS